MDIYDQARKRLEKFNQAKLLTGTIIVSAILIVIIVGFVVVVNKRASEGKHLFDPSGKVTEKRHEEEKKRQEKILEKDGLKEVYDKLFVDRDLSF